MQNKEIVVVNGQELSFKEQSRELCEQYVTNCLQNAKGPAKQLANSFVEELINYLISYVRQRFAA